MYATPYAIGLPFLIVVVLSLGLHALGRLLILSSPRRSRYLFAGTSWLPLRRTEGPLVGEEVDFATSGHLTLRGTLLTTQTESRKGTILFCHELNGTRSNILPYVDHLLESGFNVFAFDFRGHGQSDSGYRGQPTPWLTTSDIEDVRAAIEYLRSRSDIGGGDISVFGLGKGATVALCAAGSDPRVKSVVLDAPMPDNRLFDRNCWLSLVKSTRLSRRRISKFVSLFLKAVLYTITCPIVSVALAWRRFMLGLWCDCRFVNPWPMVRKVRQPIMIVHGHVDSVTRADQIQAFCDRMPIRPKLWLVPAVERNEQGTISEDCCRQVARFLSEHDA